MVTLGYLGAVCGTDARILTWGDPRLFSGNTVHAPPSPIVTSGELSLVRLETLMVSFKLVCTRNGDCFEYCNPPNNHPTCRRSHRPLHSIYHLS